MLVEEGVYKVEVVNGERTLILADPDREEEIKRRGELPLLMERPLRWRQLNCWSSWCKPGWRPRTPSARSPTAR